MVEVKDWQAPAIKIAAVISAASRWVGALLAAEGFDILAEWATWWIPLSAIMGAAMAIVEGMAFAYIFGAWKDDQEDNKLLYIALLSGVVFVLVLTPYIAAQVVDQELAVILAWRPALYAWSAAVAASTIVIVAGVGYAERRKQEQLGYYEPHTEWAVPVANDTDTSPFEPVIVERKEPTGHCWCGEPCYEEDTEEWYQGHLEKWHLPQIAQYGGDKSASEVLDKLRLVYGGYEYEDQIAPFPTVLDIVRWKKLE